jgi:hypothetical protein
MTMAGNFIAALQREQMIGNVSSETEQHLKHEFRRLGGSNASHTGLAAAVEAETTVLNARRRRSDGFERAF